jgi:hypothetical protein
MALILSGDTGVPASGMPTGSVIQTVNTTFSTQSSTSSTSQVDTGLTATITPISSTSKILVSCSMTGLYSTGASFYPKIYLLRNSTTLFEFGGAVAYSSAGGCVATSSTVYLDAPTTISATTYSIQIKSSNGSQIYWQNNNSVSCLSLQEIHG